MVAVPADPLIQIGVRTDAGRARAHNEDAFKVAQGLPEAVRSAKGTLMVVADGVGGLEAGEVASSAATQAAYDSYYADADSDIGAALQRAAQTAHQAVRRAHVAGKATMASTLVMAVIHGQALHIVNVGDSRAYVLRGGRLRQLSTDHSLVAAQLRQGNLSAEEARRYAHRNVLTRSLGMPRDRIQPDQAALDWEPGDRLLLCSDGLWNIVDEALIERLLARGSVEAAAEQLVQAANQAGGADNITVVVAESQDRARVGAPVMGTPATMKRAWRGIAVIAGLGMLVGVLAVGVWRAGWLRTAAPQRSVTERASPQPAASQPTAPPLSPAPATASASADATAALQAPIATPTPTPTPTSTSTPTPTPTSEVALAFEATATLAPLPALAAFKFCTRLTGVTCRVDNSIFPGRTRSVYVTWDRQIVQNSEAFDVDWSESADAQRPKHLHCTLSANRRRCVENDVAPMWAKLNDLRPGRYSVQMSIAGRPMLSGNFQISQ